jgi:hypothetical protein
MDSIVVAVLGAWKKFPKKEIDELVSQDLKILDTLITLKYCYHVGSMDASSNALSLYTLILAVLPCCINVFLVEGWLAGISNQRKQILE